MSSHDDLLTLEQFWLDLLLVIWQHSLGSQLERLSTWWWNVVGSTPDVNLFITELLSGIVLVEASQVTIVTLVEGLVLFRWDALLADLLELDGEGVLCSGQGRGEGQVEVGL